MKKFLLSALAAVLVCSCSTGNLPQKMDAFVDNAELKGESYSDTDWQKSAEDFQILMDQFNTGDHQYTEAERQMAARAIGRYHALLIKNGIKKSGELLQGIGKILPEYLEGLATEFEQGAGELATSLESMVDTSAIESALDRIGNVLEEIFGVPEE